MADEQRPFCGNCGMPCNVDWVEDGVGGYEFWGQRGVDTMTYAQSDCCEDVVFDDASLERELRYERT